MVAGLNLLYYYYYYQIIQRKGQHKGTRPVRSYKVLANTAYKLYNYDNMYIHDTYVHTIASLYN